MSIQTSTYYSVIAQLPADSTLVLRHVSWEDYEALLDAVGEAKGLRLSYDQGTLYIMTLSPEHEHLADLIHDFVRLLSMRRQIRVLSFGSATMKKQRQEKGSEPDACFYVQSAERIGKKKELDFSSDPPPDIVVEVDLHHESLAKFPIYAALGVPEIWRYDGAALTMYHLQQEQYVVTPRSLALPLLTSSTLTEFLRRSQDEDQFETLLAFETWLQAQAQ